MGVELLSADLNGTLVKSHTMQEMIRYGFPGEPHRYTVAKEAFSAQVKGKIPIAEAFRVAGRQTKDLSLESAVDYALHHMPLMEGFGGLMDFVRARAMSFCIVSTGYSVTLYTMRYGMSMPPFHMRCNRLLFSRESGPPLSDSDLEDLVRQYIEHGDGACGDYKATGEILLEIGDESHKPALILQLAKELGVAAEGVAHVGDTMGDSRAILEVARAGGLGIAFNYNEELGEFLLREGVRELESGRIIMVDPKGAGADLVHILPFLE